MAPLAHGVKAKSSLARQAMPPHFSVLSPYLSGHSAYLAYLMPFLMPRIFYLRAFVQATPITSMVIPSGNSLLPLLGL